MKRLLRKKLIKDANVNKSEWSILSSNDGLKITSEYGASLIHSNGSEKLLTLAYIVPIYFKADISAYYMDKRLYGNEELAKQSRANLEKLEWSYMSVNSERADAFMMMDNTHEVVEYINSELCTKADRADFESNLERFDDTTLYEMTDNMIKKQKPLGVLKYSENAYSTFACKDNGELSHFVAFRFSGGWRMFVPTHEHLKSFVKAYHHYQRLNNPSEVEVELFKSFSKGEMRKVKLNEVYA